MISLNSILQYLYKTTENENPTNTDNETQMDLNAVTEQMEYNIQMENESAELMSINYEIDDWEVENLIEESTNTNNVL
jgi:hemolysin activation/secretion protein